MELGAPISLKGITYEFACPGGTGGLYQCMGSGQPQVDPVVLNHELHTATRILLDDEKVLMVFKTAGHDTNVFTNLRVLRLDVQGSSGVHIQYTSIPFKRYEEIRIWEER